LRSFLAACRYLTILPAPGPETPGGLGAVAGWFPVVGLVLGALLALAAVGLDHVTPPTLGSALVVAWWVGLTGGLHLDGLGDALDGLGGGVDRARALALMREGGLGAFGVTGIVLVLALKLAALGGLSVETTWRALVVTPVVGRVSPVLLGWWCPPARASGAGQAFVAGLNRVSLAGAVAVGAAVTLGLFGLPGTAVLSVLGLSAPAAWYLRRRLGGLTGDCLGALVEITEAAALVTIAALDHRELLPGPGLPELVDTIMGWWSPASL
jgi:adenosylcobinamide-GDP ribazoletransferase